MDVWVHCRGQQAVEMAVVGGETAVTVTVMTHWYWDWGHGDLQVEPMAQHCTLEPAGSMMQYVLSGQHEVAPRGPMSLPVQALAPDLAVKRLDGLTRMVAELAGGKLTLTQRPERGSGSVVARR